MDETAERPPTKQVIVIRRDLRMRRGKEIAQGAHAAMAWLAERVIQRMTPDGTVDHLELSEAERTWLETSFRKVTVKVGSEAAFLEPPVGKDIDAQMVVDLRHMLTKVGYAPS